MASEKIDMSDLFDKFFKVYKQTHGSVNGQQAQIECSNLWREIKGKDNVATKYEAEKLMSQWKVNVKKPGKCSIVNFFTKQSSTKKANCGPLAGIKVLDLTRILAGPFCTMILGDLGAEIIKVENPNGGDETRRWGPPFVGSESCYFASVNRNKKSVAVNLKSPEGISLCKKLSKKCDILVENYIPGKLDKLGLGYRDLKDVAPHLIYCTISGFGPNGPYSHRAGYDVIAASIGGLLHMTGPSDGEPSKVGVAMTDLATGLYMHGAIMAALLERQRTNRGQKIDCNLLSTQVSLLMNIGSNFLNAGLEAKRLGTAHESIVPYQAFKTDDGYLTIGAASNEHFAIMCKRLELEFLLDDPRFTCNKSRVENRDELIKILSNRFVSKTTKDWLETLEGCGIPYGPVNNMKQAFSDPQVMFSKIVQKLEHPTAGTISVTGPAVTFSDSTNAMRSPPPLLGEHTRQILDETLQLTETELKDLAEKGIITLPDFKV